MRRTLALCAAAVLVRAAPVAADPNDLDLDRLGAPTSQVWRNIRNRFNSYADPAFQVTLSDADADRLASQSQ